MNIDLNLYNIFIKVYEFKNFSKVAEILYVSQPSVSYSIKELENQNVNILVVCKDGKYGLLNLDDRALIGDCILDKIYSKTESGEKIYYIQLQGQEVLLKNYIKKINTTTVDISQQ